jgi:hypothetical protein
MNLNEPDQGEQGPKRDPTDRQRFYVRARIVTQGSLNRNRDTATFQTHFALFCLVSLAIGQVEESGVRASSASEILAEVPTAIPGLHPTTTDAAQLLRGAIGHRDTRVQGEGRPQNLPTSIPPRVAAMSMMAEGPPGRSSRHQKVIR